MEGLFGNTESPVIDKIGYAAEVVAVFGDSGRWGVWVERNLAGLVASADPPSLAMWELEQGPFLSAEDALDDFLSLNLGDSSADVSFAADLCRNYGAFEPGSHGS